MKRKRVVIILTTILVVLSIFDTSGFLLLRSNGLFNRWEETQNLNEIDPDFYSSKGFDIIASDFPDKDYQLLLEKL